MFLVTSHFRCCLYFHKLFLYVACIFSSQVNSFHFSHNQRWFVSFHIRIHRKMSIRRSMCFLDGYTSKEDLLHLIKYLHCILERCCPLKNHCLARRGHEVDLNSNIDLCLKEVMGWWTKSQMCSAEKWLESKR